MVHASPSVRAILKAHRCVNDIDVLVAFQRIQAGRYDDVARKANNPELKREQSARAELGFTKAKAKTQALNELLDDARTQQPRIDGDVYSIGDDAQRSTFPYAVRTFAPIHANSSALASSKYVISGRKIG